ncbi:hypothetical protein Tco_0378108 [Tanacetum coccineum]
MGWNDPQGLPKALVQLLEIEVDVLILGERYCIYYLQSPRARGLVEEDKLGAAVTILNKATSLGLRALLLTTDVVIADKLSPDANSKVPSNGLRTVEIAKNKENIWKRDGAIF